MDGLTDNPALHRYELAVDGAVAFVQDRASPRSAGADSHGSA